MTDCYECNKHVWIWQEKVESLDGVFVAHKKCCPQGFHGTRRKKKRK